MPILKQLPISNIPIYARSEGVTQGNFLGVTDLCSPTHAWGYSAQIYETHNELTILPISTD